MLLQPPKSKNESVASSFAAQRNEFARRLKKDSFASNIDSTKKKQM